MTQANPDKPHAYKPRKITWKGEPVRLRPLFPREAAVEPTPPCSVCGGSPTSLVHLR